MVRTRKGATTGEDFEERQTEDPLEDTASHVPLITHQSRLGESARLHDDTELRQTEGSQLGGLNQQRQGVVPLATTPVPAAMPTLHADPALIAQIVRAVIEAMLGASAPTAPVAPAVQTILVATAPVDSVVTLVRTVNSVRELGCEPFLGEPDAEIAGRWLRTIEDTVDHMQVAEGLRVNCAAHLLSDRARSWWDTVRSRRPAGSWSWAEFREQFEHQFYSSYHQKIKEQEFLALKQADMSVLDCERRFHDLSMFASHYTPSEQHRVERLRDGLRQELRQGLVAFNFGTTRELIEAAEALEACLREGQQGQYGLGKRKEAEYTSGRPLLPKRGKGQFSQFKRGGSTLAVFAQTSGVRSTTRQPNHRGGFFTGTSEQKTITYPLCTQYGQRHPGDCSATPG
jgi:hypothetical protein